MSTTITEDGTGWEEDLLNVESLSLLPRSRLPAPAPMKTASSLSKLYMQCLGCIFSIAYISYYVQYPALSSRSGIEPSERAFKQAFPLIYDFIVETGYSDADSFVELLTLLGLILSMVIARWGLLYLIF